MALREPIGARYCIVAAHPDHLDEITRIESESFLIPWKRAFFENELTESYRYTRVAVGRDGAIPQVAGYLFAVSLYEEFHINKIATDPRVRGQGLGRELLENALAHARAQQATAVTLEVRVSNVPAREFYASYGFREAYRRKAYYQDGEDALAMILALPPLRR